MIIAKAPLRISIGGGGTDLPSYFENNNGTIFSSMAINKYIYVSVNKRFLNDILIRYSSNEICKNINDIEHPIIRETLKSLNKNINSIEITSTSDIPSGTGLGSSGTFGVALQSAMRSYLKIENTKGLIAKESTRIEKDVLKRPIGLQDQYISSFGGLTEFKVDKNANVIVNKNIISDELKYSIKNNLLLFFTDFSRDSTSVLDFESNNMKDSSRKNQYNNIVDMGKDMFYSLIKNDIETYGSIMHEYWKIKQARQKSFTQKHVVELYNHVYNKKLIYGGKLVGAGGSGFLLIATSMPKEVRDLMKTLEVKELEFDIEYEGVKIIEDEH